MIYLPDGSHVDLRPQIYHIFWKETGSSPSD